MLVSRPKKKDQREGAPELLFLLPELCTMTGLTDDMKTNFRLMQDLGVQTRVNPTKRAETMNNFRNQIRSNPKAKSRLESWGVQYADNLVNVQGRLLPPESIRLGEKTVSYFRISVLFLFDTAILHISASTCYNM